MGRYAQLYVGRIFFAWKGVIPDILGFPFTDEETYAAPDPGDPEYMWFGYEAPCSLVRKRLDDQGFSLGFCQRVYEFFHNNLRQDLRFELGCQLECSTARQPTDSEVTECLAKYDAAHPSKSGAEQLLHFVDLLRAVVNKDPHDRYFSEPYIHYSESRYSSDDHSGSDPVSQKLIPASKFLGWDSSYRDNITLSFCKLSEYLLNGFTRYSPYLIMYSLLLSSESEYIHEYPEIIWLAIVRLAVEAAHHDDTVKLELSDIVDEQHEADQMPTRLAQELIDKLRLYNVAFSGIFRNEELIRSRFMRSECARLLAECDKADSAYERGRALEDLVEMLFTANGTLHVATKRVSTDDEEIDIVIRNDIDRPFWLAFTSPLFLVECKNWSTRVGTSAIRDFEVKLQNHRSLVRLGFFFALNGFSSEVQSEMKRLGRDNYHLVLLDRQDLEEYLNASGDFITWLEPRVARIY